MATIQPVAQNARYLIQTLEIDGITNVGELTGISNILDADTIWAEGDAEFLAAAQGNVTDYNPIPTVGEWCEAGVMYGYNNGIVICRQSHTRMNYTPEETPALWLFYQAESADAEWIVGEQVYVGTIRTYDGTKYVCLQAHVTQVDWTPPAVLGVLWAVYQSPEEYQPWVQPTGAHDAYNIGDRVTFNGHLWESVINANVWSPLVYGWNDLGIYP